MDDGRKYLSFYAGTEEEKQKVIKLLAEARARATLVRGYNLRAIDVIREALKLYIEKLKEEEQKKQ